MSFAKLGAAVGSLWGPTGAAIGGGLGSLADGELASEKARKKAKFNHLAKLRKDAEAAGFNPLTALRATGGQGFSHGASGAMASASFWSSFANSAGQIAGQFDPLRKAQREANLAETRANTAYLGSLVSAAGKAVAAKPSKSSNHLDKTVYPSTPSIQSDPETPVYAPGILPTGYTAPKETMEQFPIHVGPVQMAASPMSAAAVIEEQWGDVASWGYGVAKMMADMYATGLHMAHGKGAQGFNNPQRGKDLKRLLSTPVLQMNNGFGPMSAPREHNPH